MRNYLLLFAGCVLFHTAGTWNLPLIDRDEPRFAEAAREMRERGDFIVPFFNNEFRFDKPPLTYWFQVANYWLFGENDFAARFPTAIAASLTSVVVLAWGTRLQDARAGWWGAVMFTLCLQMFVHGKAAVADMWLVLFVTIAHWMGWELLHGSSSKRLFWFFYTSLALAFLAKGPIGWTPLVSVAVARRFFSERRSRFHFFAGIVFMLALVSLWGIPALIRTGGEYFEVGIGKHVFSRSLGAMEGHGANSLGMYLALLPFYFVTLFLSFFPWSMKLPALWKNLRSRLDASDKFLLVSASIIFLIFTLVKTKLPHYTLPAFPLIALLMARRAEELKFSPKLAWGAAIVLLLVALLAPPFLSNLAPSRVLARASQPELRPEMEFGAVGYTEPSLVWYFRRHVRGFMTSLKPKDAVSYLQKEGARFVVLPTSLVARLFPTLDPSWRIYRARGWNMAKGERVDVTMLVKSSDEW